MADKPLQTTRFNWVHRARAGAVVTVLTLLSVLTAAPATARDGGDPPSPALNGRIVFGRFDPAIDDLVDYTIRPDGSGLRQLLPQPLQCPHWSPNGRQIATCGNFENGATAIINPATRRYRLIPMPDPTLFTACFVWTPDGKRLACESTSDADPTRNGIYTIRVSDGRGLRLLAKGPNEDDIPGDFSPDGERLVYFRGDLDGNALGLFVARVHGGVPTRITAPGMLIDSSTGSWSPRGNQILFSRHVNSDVRDSIWVVGANGRNLHEIHLAVPVPCGGAKSDPTTIGCFDPRWSPDGRSIVFGVNASTGENIYTAKADGSHVRQITHSGADEVADWGPRPSHN